MTIQALTTVYAILAVFVVQSIERNHREQRASPRIVTAFGWGLCSMSATLSVLALGLALTMLLGSGAEPSALDLPTF